MNDKGIGPRVVATVSNEFTAQSMIAALEGAGIFATAIGGFTAGFRAEAPGHVAITVRAEDEQRALETLRNFEEAATNIDWSQVDVGEPLE